MHETTATIIGADGSTQHFERAAKKTLAAAIVEKAEKSFLFKRGVGDE